MSFNILFIGDIYGQLGRKSVRKNLPSLKIKYDIDFVIANGENVTHGKGLSKSHYLELMDDGVDFFTLGNHYKNKIEILEWIDNAKNIIRPANLPLEKRGKGSQVVETKKGNIRISNIIGKLFMNKLTISSPYEAMEEILLKSKEKYHIVDIHAEATSEKINMFYFLKSKVSAIVGTHTHVQTADEKIEGDTAYITDVGFCGASESVIGVNLQGAYTFSRYGIIKDVSPAKRGKDIFNGVVIKLDEESGKAIEIIRINLK